jgi:hypothetical protein
VSFVGELFSRGGNFNNSNKPISLNKDLISACQVFRGKGLKQLLDFIKNQGQLTIISNKGYCSFQVENEKLTTTQQKELKYPLQGTLIEWQINV